MGTTDCHHCQDRADLGFEGPCMEHDPTPDDLVLRSKGITFGTAGRADFHGDQGTIRERTDELFANAKKYGNEPPEYVGPRSKMRPYSELAAE